VRVVAGAHLPLHQQQVVGVGQVLQELVALPGGVVQALVVTMLGGALAGQVAGALVLPRALLLILAGEVLRERKMVGMYDRYICIRLGIQYMSTNLRLLNNSSSVIVSPA
jgi:hypothetical protein